MRVELYLEWHQSYNPVHMSGPLAVRAASDSAEFQLLALQCIACRLLGARTKRSCSSESVEWGSDCRQRLFGMQDMDDSNILSYR